nr:immunoglobulin heavy chain junction region [Macaca mulatta]MOW48138.1 immunoglobulin heavy chain junction region [Macaca mulatta]
CARYGIATGTLDVW